MRVDNNATMVAEVQQFIEELRRLMDEAEAAGSDLARIATVYDINLQPVKKVTSADLVVAVSPTAGGQVVLRKTDPNQTHPYSQRELLAKVNTKRRGRTLTTRDHQALSWKHGLRDNPALAWKHSNGASHVWSGEAVSYLASLADETYDEVRAEYNDFLRARTTSTPGTRGKVDSL